MPQCSRAPEVDFAAVQSSASEVDCAAVQPNASEVDCAAVRALNWLIPSISIVNVWGIQHVMHVDPSTSEQCDGKFRLHTPGP